MIIKRALAILATAGLVSMSVAAPAAATDDHAKPKVTVEKVKFTERVRAGEACTFPVRIKAAGTTKIVEKGNEVWTYNKADSFFTVKNLKNGKKVRLSAEGGFYDRVQANGDLHTKAWGNTFYWTTGDPTKPDTGGFEFFGSSGAAPGMVYVQGKAWFTVTDPADPVKASFHFKKIEGTATSVCGLID